MTDNLILFFPGIFRIHLPLAGLSQKSDLSFRPPGGRVQRTARDRSLINPPSPLFPGYGRRGSGREGLIFQSLKPVIADSISQ